MGTYADAHVCENIRKSERGKVRKVARVHAKRPAWVKEAQHRAAYTCLKGIPEKMGGVSFAPNLNTSFLLWEWYTSRWPCLELQQKSNDINFKKC